MKSLAFFAGRLAGAAEQAEQAERAEVYRRWQKQAEVGWLERQAEVCRRQAGDRQAGWNGRTAGAAGAAGRSIQAVAKTGRGRPIMTEIIGAGKFRAS